MSWKRNGSNGKCLNCPERWRGRFGGCVGWSREPWKVCKSSWTKTLKRGKRTRKKGALRDDSKRGDIWRRITVDVKS